MGVEDVAQPRDGDSRLLEILPQLRQPQHRLRHAARQHVEGDELADGHLAVDHRQGAEIENGGGDDLAYHLHSLGRPIAKREHAEARPHIARELFLPAPLHLRLDRHGLQGLDAGDALDQEGLVFSAAVEFLVEAPAEHRRDGGRDRDVEREGSEHDAGEEQRIVGHHRQEDEGEEEIDDQGERRTRQEIADVLELAHARHRIAGAARLEIGDGQRHQMAEKASAQLDIDAVGGVREDIGAQTAENRSRTARSQRDR